MAKLNFTGLIRNKSQQSLKKLSQGSVQSRYFLVNLNIESKIIVLFEKFPGIDEVDIANRLNLDLKTVSAICDRLLREGKIKRD